VITTSPKHIILAAPKIAGAAIFACFLALVGLAGCGNSDDEANNPLTVTESTVWKKPLGSDRLITLSQAQQNSVLIKTVPAIESDVTDSVETTGEVLANANLMTHVNAPITGRVTEVLVSIGDCVSAGQSLAWVKSTDIEQLEASLLQNDAQVKADLKRDLLQINSDISQDSAQVGLSTSTYNRIRDLYNDKIASRADYEAARAQFEEDTIALKTAQQKRNMTIALAEQRLRVLTEPVKQSLRVLNVSDATINNLLRTRQIQPLVAVSAPESGIVVERLVNIGELVDPSKPIFTVGDFRNVWLNANVPEKDIEGIKTGEQIELRLDSFPEQVFYGNLNYVADIVNEDTRTLTVRAQVDNPESKLKPDMYGRMKILLGMHHALLVPKAAVQDAGSCLVVYVPSGPGKFLERAVQTGDQHGNMVTITHGLSPGENVVVDGADKLRAIALTMQ
jgi:cobalt-zinc-cadmium efflux system membrane fusion protein